MKINIKDKKYNYWDTIKINFNSGGIMALFWLIQVIILAIIPTVQIMINAAFIDKVLEIYKNKKSISGIYPLLSLVVIVIAYQWLMDPILNLVRKKMEMSIRENLRAEVINRRAKLEYQYIEDADSLDLINRVSDNPETKFLIGFDKLLSGISLLITIVGIFSILVVEVMWVSLAIMAVSIPLFYLAFKSGKATYQANKDITKYQRKYGYLSNIMINRDCVEERSVFRYNDKLNEEWINQYDVARKIELKARLKWFVKLKSGSVITAILCIFVSFILIQPTLEGIISVGMFFSLINATYSLVHVMSWEMVRCIDDISYHNEYLKDFSVFAQMRYIEDACDRANESVDFKTLKFEHVYFKYPNNDKYILQDFNLVIENERHYAFVGVNGAGKTTVAKILTGLYDNYEGSIKLNGEELREYSSAEIKAFFSVVYQDFAKYSVSFIDNIKLGNQNATDAELEKSVQLLKLSDVADRLPQKEKTILGKLVDESLDLSGGEWQRIALARSYISNAPIRILDEPTAALDPMAESRLYEEFATICKGKTTMFFSHRLGSIKLADTIVVISNGMVAELGTHQELLQRKGLYCEMYESQRGWYQ